MDTADERLRAPRGERWALLAVSLLSAILSYVVFRDFLFEDAYITLRYAENLAMGEGLVFQTGDAVLGTSSPLWAMVLALMIFVGIPPELSLDLGFSLALAGLGVAGGALLRRLTLQPWIAFAFPVAVALGFARLHSYWGMETPLFLMLLFAGWLLAVDRRYAVSGIVLGLASLTRYEGYGFAVALACVLAAQRSWGAMRSGGLAFAAVTLPWLGTAWAYYGSPVPSTAGAKASHVSHLRYLERSFQDLPQNLAWPISATDAPYAIGWALAVLLGIFGLVGLVRLAKERATTALALPLGALMVFSGLIYLAPGPIFAWHRAPLHYAALLIGLVGVGAVSPRGSSGRASAASLRLPWILSVLGLAASVPVLRAAHHQLSQTFQYAGRERAYGEIAAFLTDTGLNELTLLTWEPGYLAFKSDTRVLDLVGLVTEAPEFTKATMASWDSEFPPEAELVLLRAPYRPAGFELIFQGSMGAWLFVREEAIGPYRQRIEAYRADASSWNPGLAVEPLSVGPVALTPSFEGAPFIVERSGGLVSIDPEQEEMSLTAETPLFLLDAQRVTVEFQTDTPGYVQLQLIVRGQVVLSTDKELDAAATSVAWDVSEWEGRAVHVRVLALAGRGAQATFGKVAPRVD